MDDGIDKNDWHAMSWHDENDKKSKPAKKKVLHLNEYNKVMRRLLDNVKLANNR